MFCNLYWVYLLYDNMLTILWLGTSRNIRWLNYEYQTNALGLKNIFPNLLNSKSTSLTEIGVKYGCTLVMLYSRKLSIKGYNGQTMYTWSSFDRNTIIVKEIFFSTINFDRKCYNIEHVKSTCCTADKCLTVSYFLQTWAVSVAKTSCPKRTWTS